MGFLEERARLFSNPEKLLRDELNNAVGNKKHPLQSVISAANGLDIEEIVGLIKAAKFMAYNQNKLNSDHIELKPLLKMANDGHDWLRILSVFYAALEKVDDNFTNSLLAIHRIYYFDVITAFLINKLYGQIKSENYDAIKGVDTRLVSIISMIVGESYKSSIAAKHKRPKKIPTVQSLIINEMRSYKISGAQLKDFIDLAISGAIKETAFQDVTPRGLKQKRYEIIIEKSESDYQQTCGIKTLEGWWAKAGKKPS